MNEETSISQMKIIPLPKEAIEALYEMLQWPEDLERWKRISTPTRLTEIVIGDGS
jgi:hypothetical protein